MSDQTDETSLLKFHQGVWVGVVSSKSGLLEVVLGGTELEPDSHPVTAIQAFMPSAQETIERLRCRLPLAFLWRPVRVAVNQQNRVGIQFQRRGVEGSRVLFADDA